MMAPTAGLAAGPVGSARAGPRGAAGGSLLEIRPAACQYGFVASALAEHLGTADRKALVLLPTRRMVRDILKFLTDEAGILSVAAITGNVRLANRKKRWDGPDIVCSTAEMFVNDVKRGVASPDQFGLAVFVGAHRAVGRHACAKAARSLAGAARIVAVTDALPRRAERRAEMIEALRTTTVGGRAECGPGGPPRPERAVELVMVDPPPGLAAIRDKLGRTIRGACASLRESGYGELEDPPLSCLEGMLEAAGGAGAPAEDARRAVFARFALDTLEVYGPAALLDVCESYREWFGSGAALDRPPLAGIIGAVRRARDGGQNHPKMGRVVGMLAAPGRALVVAGPNGSVQDILGRLKAAGIPAAGLPPNEDAFGLAHMERNEAVNGLRGGRYRALVSQCVEDAYAGAARGGLAPDDVDMVVCCAGGAEEARRALDRGAARAVALATRGSAEDPGRWAAGQLDWETHRAVERLRREAREAAGCADAATERGAAGLAAREGERPEYRLLRRDGMDRVLGPAGAGGTFAEAAGEGGAMVRALLGRSVRREGGLMLYAVHDTRPAGERSRGTATPGQKAAPRAQLSMLEAPGRNRYGIPTEKWRGLLGGRITKEDYNAIMRALTRALRATTPLGARARNRLTHMAHLGIRGQDGGRLSLCATPDGRLYNRPADGPLSEGHWKILDYMTARELRGGRSISAIREYVESVVDRAMAETGGRPEFAG